MKPTLTRIPITLSLEYVSSGADEPGKVYRQFPVEPLDTSALTVAIRPFDPNITARYYNAKTQGRPQITLAGPSGALEEFGKYLIALARLETLNPTPNGHIDDVKNADGGTVHVVIRRT